MQSLRILQKSVELTTGKEYAYIRLLKKGYRTVY